MAYIICAKNNILFSGFLLNPIDGNSYLAKMSMGYSGEWTFSLPYTANAPSNVVLFVFYLFLGHIARLTQLPLILVFHLARLFSSLLLLTSINSLIEKFQMIDESNRIKMLAVLVFGSGMGWIVLMTGAITSDFWVAEAFPFLSSFTNPHFPFSLFLMIELLLAIQKNDHRFRKFGKLGLFSLLLSIVLPFGLGIVLMIEICVQVWNFISRRKIKIYEFCMIALCGLPFVVYDFLITLNDPYIEAWNAQNLTPSPPIWDILISFSPLLFFSILGTTKIFKNKNPSGLEKSLIVWLFAGLALINIPFSLQRRFMLGLYIPIAILGFIGFQELSKKLAFFRKSISWIILLICIGLTNILIIFGGISGVAKNNTRLTISRDEMDAMLWLRNNSEKDDIVLASADIGLLIPVYSANDVIYGHPFETLNGMEEQQFVKDVFSGMINEEELKQIIDTRKIDYIFYGEREKVFGGRIDFGEFHTVYSNETVNIYESVLELK
ncbi:MAG: hypothetical protein JEZ03_10775 [Bacteroidales bacterium]|nr:hypothetical protein [Bacteroidales bacterium]